jgi:LCP family protein required for cell wall assembly
MGNNREGRLTTKKKSKKRVVLTVVITILALVLAIMLGGGIYLYSKLSAMSDSNPFNYTGEIEPDTDDSDYSGDLSNINDNEIDMSGITNHPNVNGIYNIMMFGIDTRDINRYNGSRSDVMMLLTINTKDKTFKLTSFMRDILVPIEGHKYNKINAAFAFGGPQLAMQTVNSCFGLNVDKYVVVNFGATEKIVDAMGGVVIDVQEKELTNLNKNIRDQNENLNGGEKAQEVKSAGKQLLNGRQAVAYARIRKVGGDSARTQRQRTVIMSLLDKSKNLGLMDFNNLFSELPQYMKTNMNVGEQLSMAQLLFSMRSSEVQQLRIPLEDDYNPGRYNKASVLRINFKKTAKALQEFVYGE